MKASLLPLAYPLFLLNSVPAVGQAPPAAPAPEVVRAWQQASARFVWLRVGLEGHDARDAGLKELGRLKGLRLVDVSGCKQVTEAGVSGLRAALPRVTISTDRFAF